MISTLGKDIAFSQLSAKEDKSILGQVLFLAIALIIPTLTHKFGLNYLVAQPMHWMVLFAGLTYGCISGTLLGIIIPVCSFLVSGMPLPAALPLMIPELMAYGFLSGFLKKRTTSFGSILIALICGKIVYLGIAVLVGRVSVPLSAFIVNTWGPGIMTMAIQILMVPTLSGLYISWLKEKE